MAEPKTIERVAIYARVSTQDQNPEMQLRDLREFATRRGFAITQEYVDFATGANAKRPALDLLMRDASRRAFDAILVWKLDRFGRSTQHLVNALAELNAIGVTFVSYGDNIDLSTPTGRLMFHMIAAFAEFERGLICERVRAGIANRRAKGLPLGQPKRLIDMRRVERLRDDFGLPLRAIARELHVAPNTLYRAIREETAERELARKIHESRGQYDA